MEAWHVNEDMGFFNIFHVIEVYKDKDHIQGVMEYVTRHMI